LIEAGISRATCNSALAAYTSHIAFTDLTFLLTTFYAASQRIAFALDANVITQAEAFSA
jgi:hypothetical protein